tara:strand:- start:574 stop:768 length:195 start_codon:yes stop_codon:yes gene_type:complete
LQRWILFVINHRAGVQADEHIIERRVDRRSADVQQGAVPRAGAANKRERDCVLVGFRCRIDGNI